MEGLKAPGVGMSLNKREGLGGGLVEQERIRGKWFLQVGGHGLLALEVSTDLALPHETSPFSEALLLPVPPLPELWPWWSH